MNCREFREQMYGVAFGEAGRSTDFDQHLAGCADCRKEFAMLDFAAAGIADTPAPPAPSLSNERLRTAILSSSLKSKPSWLPRLSFAGVAAALALAAWMGYSSGTPQPGDVVAVADKDTARGGGTEPSGEIEIPEAVPPIAENVESTPVAESNPSEPTTRVKRRANNRAPRTVVAVKIEESQVPDELLAVVVGGAEGALDSEFTMSRGGPAMTDAAPAMAAPASEKSEEKPIIVIQPKGQATERSSDDIPIGG